MAAKLTVLTHRTAIQLHLVAESCIICSSRSRGQSGNFWIHPRTYFNSESDGVVSKCSLVEVQHLLHSYTDIRTAWTHSTRATRNKYH